MDGGSARRACAPRANNLVRLLGLFAALILALGSAACNSTTGQLAGPGPVAAGSGPTIAFESIDGPTEAVYTKLVQGLTEAAGARQIAVVSRGAPAQYRVRIYAATVVYPKRSVVHWVWDVYDANQQRTRRLAGEETITGKNLKTWAAADDALVRKIAHSGMDRLVAFLGSPAPAPAPVAPQTAPAATSAVAFAAAQ